MIRSHVPGFPSSGSQGEMTTALARYERGEIDASSLKETARAVRKNNWEQQRAAGLDVVTVGDFTLIDPLLDHIQMLGCEPQRFRSGERESNLSRHFAMAKGRSAQSRPNVIDHPDEVRALQTAVWFDSGHRYVKPELDRKTIFKLAAHRLLSEVAEAQALGHTVKPVLIGPLTFLWLANHDDTDPDFDRLDLLDTLLPIYVELLSLLSARGIELVQIEEPILGLDLPTAWSRAFERAYHALQRARAQLLLTTYFAPLGKHLNLVCKLPVAGLHIDAVRAGAELRTVVDWIPMDMVLSIGIIDGLDLWRTDIDAAIAQLRFARERHPGPIWIASTCSLQHLPYRVNENATIDAELCSWLAGADRKLDELALLKQVINEGEASAEIALNSARTALAERRTRARLDDPMLLQKIEAMRAA